MDVIATRLFWRRSSDSAVTTWRAPVQPRGWPRALLELVFFFFSKKLRERGKKDVHCTTAGVDLGLVETQLLDTVGTL